MLFSQRSGFEALHTLLGLQLARYLMIVRRDILPKRGGIPNHVRAYVLIEVGLSTPQGKHSTRYKKIYDVLGVTPMTH